VADTAGLAFKARLIATYNTVSAKTKKTKAWLQAISLRFISNQNFIGLKYRLRTVANALKPNWQGANSIVALLMVVVVSNIVAVRAQEDSRQFLDVEPEMAAEILDEIAPFTPFEEDLDQAKLATAGEADGFIEKPDFKETRKAGTSYTVQGGDTLEKIASKYNVTVATLLDVNGIAVKDITNIKPGQLLQIPPYNTSESTAWLEESQKIAAAKAAARAREEAKRRLALGRDGFGRGNDRDDFQSANVDFNGDSEDCNVNPVTVSKGISRGISRRHKGIDIRADQGTPIVSGKTGVVTSVGWRRGFGKTVTIRTQGEEQIYAHVSSFAEISPGQTVEQGEVIARVGSTGWSTGPHLHFEVHRAGSTVNPFKC